MLDEALHIGSYRLEEKLGEGGMGVVYRAMDERLNREVAVKILHPGMLKQDKQMERFRREARMHAKIIHPNIVTLLSLYEDEEHMALVMEMVHGQNLQEYLRQNPRPALLDVIRIAEAVCSALSVAHKFGMVHRDIKPANILLATDGLIKLMDFGLAKPQSDDDDLTKIGAAVGSFRYMAPEQILNKPVDARTDMYALGILMYQMTTGKFPFTASAEGGGEFEIMEKQVHQKPESPCKWNPALPSAISDIIMSLLAKDPDQRPANCEEVRNILTSVTRQIQHPQENFVYSHSPHDQNNMEIARGLIYSWSRHTLWFLKRGVSAIKYYILDIPSQRFHTKLSPFLTKRLNIPKRFHVVCMWGLILLLIAGGGLGLVNLNLSQTPEQASVAPNMLHPVIQPPVSVIQKKKNNPHPKKQKKPIKINRPTKAKTAARTRPVSKASQAKNSRAQVRSITYRVAHLLVRSDGSRVTGGKHEFRGGKHLFFPHLANYALKNTLHSLKTGWIRLYLTKSVKLSQILIHQASVGNRSFKNGEIKLEVENSRGHWQTLLLRKNRDIDSLLKISQPKDMLADVKGVRLKFKTPEPITIGPIDLLL